jgi:hypothetical protein
MQDRLSAWIWRGLRSFMLALLDEDQKALYPGEAAGLEKTHCYSVRQPREVWLADSLLRPDKVTACALVWSQQLRMNGLVPTAIMVTAFCAHATIYFLLLKQIRDGVSETVRLLFS